MTAKQILQAAPKRAIKIDGTLHVFIGEGLESKINPLLSKAFLAGKTVEENGVAQWFDWFPVQNPKKSGSARWQWNGDSVRVEKFLFTKRDGVVTRKSLGLVWRHASKVL